MREFDLIDRLLKPLVQPRALDDDTSLVLQSARLVINTDTIVEGRHYLAGDPPDSIAKKLVRVNVSDLASTGARPRYLSLALTLGEGATKQWLESFVAGLAEDMAHYALVLSGGDTTRTSGPSVLTATAIGDMEDRTPMRRWQARAGDRVWLGRALGIGGLGLAAAQSGKFSPLAWRYWVPDPQLDLGLRLSALGGRIACADISDGLGADLGHIARASGVGIRLANVTVEPGGDMNAGDDYCLVAVTDQNLAGMGMYVIGTVDDGPVGVTYQGRDISRIGYEHG